MDHEPDEYDPKPERPRRSWKRSLRKFAVVIGVLAAVWFVTRWQVGRYGQRQLAAVTNRLDAADRGWRFEDIEGERLRHAPPRERNGAAVVDAVKATLPDQWDKWRGSQSAPWLREAVSNHFPPPKFVAALREHAGLSAEATKLARTLRDIPTGHRAFELPDNPIAMLVPHLDATVRVIDVLGHDSMLAGVEGDADRGVRNAHAALNASRAIGDEPLLISQVFRSTGRQRACTVALNALAWGKPSAGLAELQAAFLADADEPLFLNGLRGERAMMHQLFANIESGKVSGKEIFSLCDRPPLIEEAVAAYRPLVSVDHAEYLRVMSAYVDAAKLPWHEQRAAVKAVLPDGPSKSLAHSLTRLLLPACENVVNAALRGRAQLLVTAAAIACERFRLKHDRWPNDLAELTPEFLPPLPLSPFDGRPIRYQILPDGVAISCFCADERSNIEGPPEFREPGVPGFASGARLWNPDCRGLPGVDKPDDQP